VNRRRYLRALCTVGVVATAGCGAVAGDRTLSDPTVDVESSGRKTLVFASEGEKLGHLGVDGSVDSGWLDLSTELWHREGTNVKSIALRVWMPEAASESPADVAVVSPVEGDSSPPPSVALYTPERALGTTIAITDVDDLADETISTLDLVVEPGTETATKLGIHATIELTGGGVLGSHYTLDGELQLAYPGLSDQ
jgi:hypothetical protein